MSENEVLSAKAESLGLGRDELADMIDKYGHPIVDMVEDAIRNGLSLNLIREVLDNFGPLVLQILTVPSLFKLGAEPLVEGETVKAEDLLFKALIERFLKTALERYGDVLLQKALAFVIKLLSDMK